MAIGRTLHESTWSRTCGRTSLQQLPARFILAARYESSTSAICSGGFMV
jgi:hypothetical protein